MTGRMTAAQTTKRETLIKGLIDDGLTVNQIARRLDVSQQAIRKFINLRGWKTSTDVKVEEKEDRKAKRRAMKK